MEMKGALDYENRMKSRFRHQSSFQSVYRKTWKTVRVGNEGKIKASGEDFLEIGN